MQIDPTIQRIRSDTRIRQEVSCYIPTTAERITELLALFLWASQ